jgi:hypothetical protein
VTTINIPQEELNSLLGKAILDSLTPDARNTIIAEAIAHLNKPVGESWQRDKQTPLQMAFNRAVDQLTQVLVRELIEDVFRDQIKGQVEELLQGIPERTELTAEAKTRIMTAVFDALREG